MYCPNCAAPIEGVKYCRSCGANVSLVPQALSGQLPAASGDETVGRRHKRRGNKTPTIEKAASTFFTGVGFLFASFMVMRYFPGGFTWGWALLIPAFACIGEGIGQYLRLKEHERQKPFQFQAQPNFQPPARAPEISAPTTSELRPPPSVTEQTTKNLNYSGERD